MTPTLILNGLGVNTQLAFSGMSRYVLVMGRPRKIIDEKAILELASKGRTLTEIAAYCGVSDDTISRRFAEVVKRGKSLMRGSLRAKQFELAMRGNPTMLVWLGKQELGQTDRQQVSGRFEHEHADLSHLSDEQLAEIQRILEAADSQSAASQRVMESTGEHGGANGS